MNTKKTEPNILWIGGPNSRFKQPNVPPAGFWTGLWHGLIAPFVFLVGLFNDDIKMYETNNNGRWYDFGFLLGIGAFSGGTNSTIH